MTDTYLTPDPEQIKALLDLPLEGPVVMLNLLKFRPDGGAEEYSHYANRARPFLDQAGATLRYLGDVAGTVIGGEEWDEAILIEYPSKQAFLDMTGDPDYPSDVRRDSIVDSRLYCMQSREAEV